MQKENIEIPIASEVIEKKDFVVCATIQNTNIIVFVASFEISILSKIMGNPSLLVDGKIPLDKLSYTAFSSEDLNVQQLSFLVLENYAEEEHYMFTDWKDIVNITCVDAKLFTLN